MDPNKTYQLIQDSLREGELIDAIDHAIDLAGWCNMGGFRPDGLRKRELFDILHFLMGLDPDDSLRNAKRKGGE